MNLPGIGAIALDQNEADTTPSLPLGLVGAAGGALVVGLLYGVIGRFMGELSYVAFLVGAASGFAGATLGRSPSIPVGIAAAVFTLVGMLAGKLVIGAPAGTSWIAYHTTPFDIIFCYLVAPAAALALGGVPQARKVVDLVRRRVGI